MPACYSQVTVIKALISSSFQKDLHNKLHMQFIVLGTQHSSSTLQPHKCEFTIPTIPSPYLLHKNTWPWRRKHFSKHSNYSLAFTYMLEYIGFQILNQPCISGINPICLLLYYILLKFLNLCLWEILLCSFFHALHLSGLDIRVKVASFSGRDCVELVLLFFISLVEFSKETIWPCKFLFQEILIHEFNFHNRSRTIQIICFRLGDSWQFILFEELIHFTYIVKSICCL